MGVAYADIELSNARRSDLAPLALRAMADTGAMTLCIPEHVALQLGLQTVYEREVTLADGRKATVPYVGPIRVTFANRGCFVGALVLGDKVVLGAIPMQDMDVVVLPDERKVGVNPLHPDIAHGYVKACPSERLAPVPA